MRLEYYSSPNNAYTKNSTDTKTPSETYLFYLCQEKQGIKDTRYLVLKESVFAFTEHNVKDRLRNLMKSKLTHT